MSKQMRGRVIAAVAIAAGLVAATVATATDRNAERRSGRLATAFLLDRSGTPIGLVRFEERRGHVVVSGRVDDLTPGFHGFHVHAIGVCDSRATDAAGQPAPFASAGGHLNPAGADHRDHAGDMPPLLVMRDGSAYTRFATDRLRRRALFDADGSAVIVHQGPDNLANIPTRYQSSAATAPGPDAATLETGDSGARVACGVLRRG